MSDNIKVVVKVRPLISREIDQKLSYQWRVRNNTLHQLDNNGKDSGAYFTFDKVYDENTKTQEVYNDIAKPIVEAAVAGFNGTIFAYGQTSSGKTYTMTGSDTSPGIIPLAVLNLYNIIKTVPDRDFLVRVSYIEIYNETLKDLLDVENKNIKIRDTLQGGVKVEATEKVTSTPEEVLEIMKEGETNRQTGATNMNEESSRSHSIFQIIIESREHVDGEKEAGCVNVSQLNLVDLAGSERSGQTGATGMRFKEGTHINKSLSVLALVIKQLSEDPNKHANYRDSKLTRILQNSLGGNAKTSIICAVTPASVEETISTLQFANRAKAIKNKPEVNAVATDATMIQSLTKQLSKLQSELASKKNIEQVNLNLQKQIAGLEKLILNGFSQRSRIEIDSSRRKLYPPRRVTISTLHPIQEDPVPTIPKFCTPSLKYNPMSLANSTEFLPIQNTSKLCSLPEESTRPVIVTPPPIDKKVNFEEEIIEIDSDEENISDIQTCSPYHKCRDSTKTPPCILRKTAKLAEKNLKDIVELTEREKMYTPEVVELIEKLEANAAIMSKLKDQLDALTKESKEKDSEVETLRNKISKAEEEVNNITSVKENLCKDYNIKLTDWEVSYETLKKKAKIREEELLARLQEQEIVKKKEQTDKSQPKTIEKELLNFMDLSKDISLVNSESSVNMNDEEASAQVQELIADMQAQLTSKNQAINDLETNILQQKRKIESLENSSQNLQAIIDRVNDKLHHIEGENSFLKSTIETLNSTIENQKASLIASNNDIKSYTTLIQELQIKLTKKDNILDAKINDPLLETMISNEEKFIANNENMKNIVQSFRIALDSRNKEINNLKTNSQKSSQLMADKLILKEHLEEKERQVTSLIEQVENLKDQLNENIVVINRLVAIEQELTDKLNIIQEQNDTLRRCKEENKTCIEKLEEINNKLTLTIVEKETKTEDISNRNLDLTKKIEDMSLKITSLEKQLTEQDKEKCEYLSRAECSLNSLQDIFEILNYHDLEYPISINSFENFFDIFEENLKHLKVTTVQISVDRKQIDNNLTELKKEYCNVIDNLQSELTILKTHVEKSSTERNELHHNNENLSQQINQLTDDLLKYRNDLYKKNRELIDMEAELNDTKENNEILRNDLLSKDNIISILEEEVTSLRLEIQALTQEIDNIIVWKKEIENLKITMQSNQDSFNEILKKKDKEIEEILENGFKQEENNILEEKHKDMLMLTEKLNCAVENRNELLNNILTKVSKITNDFGIDNNLSSDFQYDNSINTHEEILLALDKIADHITQQMGNENIDIADVLSEAKTQIKELTQQNIQLMNDFSEIDTRNSELLDEIEQIKIINKNLSGTSELLEQLKIELKVKSKELDHMELKAREFKSQFTEFENIMKEQLEGLQLQNEKLTNKLSQPQRKSFNESSSSVHSNDEYCHDFGVRKSISNFVEKVNKSPQSLLTICCNKIIDTLQLNESDYNSLTTSSSKSYLEMNNTKTEGVICKCIELSLQLEAAKAENLTLLNCLTNLESSNQSLLSEQEEIRKEINLLLEPANELQKKILNHRTNLSTLTATTYAENKLLNSQLKVLKHYHTRYIHVCQRDIPAFKAQLHELLAILKGNTSFTEKQNMSFKRYSLPDVLDSNNSMSNFKNESTLDGDLLMIDTNVTLTSADNTLTGHDQTCLDVTQINFDNEVACQTNDLSTVLDPYLIYSQIEMLTNDNRNLSERLKMLSDENQKLQNQISTYSTTEQSIPENNARSSPIKLNSASNLLLNENDTDVICSNSKGHELKIEYEKLLAKYQAISQELSCIKTQKEDIEKEHTNLKIEISSMDALIQKLHNLEKEHNFKLQELTKISNDLNRKNIVIKDLQQENDTLSTQVMESISEADDLKKELDILKESNTKLSDRCNQLELLSMKFDATNKSTIIQGPVNCPQFVSKDDLSISLPNEQKLLTHTKLNRSLSDSDSSSRFNKINTLQNELHASKEDCKKITEEVTTIKNQLECSNLSITQSMDLDESMGDSNIFTFTKEFNEVSQQLNKSKLTYIPEETPVDMYALDKLECFNYYMSKTDSGKENLSNSRKILDIMKMLYDFLVTKHSNEIENLTNRLKHFDESKCNLVSQLNELTQKYSKVHKELEEKDNNLKTITNVLSHLKNNIDLMKVNVYNDTNFKIDDVFKENFLKLIDGQLGLSSVNIFEQIIKKHQKILTEVTERHTELQINMESILKEFKNVSDDLNQLKSQLKNKESEYDLLKVQKEKVHEICSAVTLDIIRKEKELNNTISTGCEKLLELNILTADDIDISRPANKNINLLFELLITHNNLHNNSNREKEKLILEVKKSQCILEENQKEIEFLKNELVKNEDKLKEQKSLHEDLNNIYDSKVEENKANLDIIESLTDEIKVLKEKIIKKDNDIQILESEINSQKQKNINLTENKLLELTQRIEDLVHENDNLKTAVKSLENEINHKTIHDAMENENMVEQLMIKIKNLIHENESLKSINEIIRTEKEACCKELDKTRDIIEQNKIELDKMTSDILVLREAIKENMTVIETLKHEAKSLLQQNMQLKDQFDAKCQECSRLEVNIKTHEKTAEIQSKMIIRHRSQKEEDEKQIEELTQKCMALQNDWEQIKLNMNNCLEEIKNLKAIRVSLEVRVSELETEAEGKQKQRLSIDALADNSRRRRQSIHDSKRMFAEDKLDINDHSKIEAMFESRGKPEDLFMDVDYDSSNRSTPARLSKGRDSLPRQDQSDKDEEHSSRPNSVMAIRRRRQSIHDQHRCSFLHTPSPHGLDHQEQRQINQTDVANVEDNSNNSEVSHLRQQLESCQQELEELKDRYRELDEECETCAQYLRERDDQCTRLKKEKTALENQVKELNEKLKCYQDGSYTDKKPIFAHASVNTDEDWANLHSVVVDRMSYDAEVEKNKKLTKTIEDLRYKKQELKNTLAKMQKALEKYSSHKDSREFEMMKSELKACKQELSELKQKYKELDEECETCAEYLKERDEQCRKLREAKSALEAKLQQFEEHSAGIAQSMRKKRQSLHDQNRGGAADVTDASTETSDDFLSYQVERDDNSQKVAETAQAREVKLLKVTLDRMSKEKAALEHLASSQMANVMPAVLPTMYVATGSAIVQNQQITDVMKENQKLKKINAKLIQICKKRGKSSHDSNRENEEPSEQG